MNIQYGTNRSDFVSAGCHINDVMNQTEITELDNCVSAGCHINDVMNKVKIRLTNH